MMRLKSISKKGAYNNKNNALFFCFGSLTRSSSVSSSPASSLLLQQQQQCLTQRGIRTLSTVSSPSSSLLLSQNEIKQQHHRHNQQQNIKRFSTSNHSNSKKDEKTSSKSNSSLHDAVNRIKDDGETTGSNNNNNNNNNNNDAQINDMYHRMLDSFQSFSTSLSETWNDLQNAGRPEDINKKIASSSSSSRKYTGAKDDMAEDDNEAADRYEGSKDLMIVDPKEQMSAWERMQQRLAEAPIIQNILGRSHEIYHKSGMADAKRKMDDIAEDAREAWETSQNPWIYRISSVYDTITAESEYALAVRELRKLDPDFTLEKWKHDVIEHTIPKIMDMFLQGRIKELKPWLGDSVYNRLAAEMRARKKDGVYIDTNVLSIMNSEILACEPDESNHGSPIILLHYMCQQINCVRKKEDNSIIEGSEDDIRANSYVLAFQREYHEEKGELNWKIVDFRFNGAIAYL